LLNGDAFLCADLKDRADGIDDANEEEKHADQKLRIR
jgi:hypothetical protein